MSGTMTVASEPEEVAIPKPCGVHIPPFAVYVRQGAMGIDI